MEYPMLDYSIRPLLYGGFRNTSIFLVEILRELPLAVKALEVCQLIFWSIIYGSHAKILLDFQEARL